MDRRSRSRSRTWTSTSRSAARSSCAPSPPASATAAGIVEAVGPQVSELKAGDHVIACLSVFCGQCDYCLTGKTYLCQTRPVRAKSEPPKLAWNGEPVNQFANLSSYAEKMLV